MKQFLVFVNLFYLSFITNVYAQVEDVFDDMEEKGSVIIEFLTSGFFAVLVVTIAIIYCGYMLMQRKMEFTTALVIFLGSVVLGNAPQVAQWLIS